MKPCPFCGSTNLREANETMPYVECYDCGAFGPTATVRKNIIAMAARLWNARREESSK